LAAYTLAGVDHRFAVSHLDSVYGTDGNQPGAGKDVKCGQQLEHNNQNQKRYDQY